MCVCFYMCLCICVLCVCVGSAGRALIASLTYTLPYRTLYGH